MDLNLSGKNAFVGGSSKGIGWACAQELAELGANITLVSRSEDRLQALVRELPTQSGQHHDYLVADYSQPDALKQKLEELPVSKLYHILVNNTGGPPGGLIAVAETEEFMAAYQQHLICNHILAQKLVPGMKAAGYGRIINIISTSVKAPLPGLGVSNTVRAAVANWAKTLATELGPDGITVNSVLPGATDTARIWEIIRSKAKKAGITEEAAASTMQNKIPMARFAAPAEIAAAVAFLASPAASYITGVALAVDGGRLKNL